jgi:RNA recognition motif-containing protein
LDQTTGKSKGFAFVDMQDDQEAKSAIKCLNMTIVDNSKVRVKKATP